MNRLLVEVVGVPAPKGSGFRLANGGYVPGRSKAQNERIRSWAGAVAEATAAAMEREGWRRLEGPCSLDVTFHMPELASDRYRTRHVASPDLDKLVRNTVDALVAAGALRNDNALWAIAARKRHTDGATGARLVLRDDGADEATDREGRKAAAAEGRRRVRAATGQGRLVS